MKTVEELLIKRWKVISDFPRSVYVVGEIIVHGQIGRETQINYDKYPNLFQLLHWADERKVEDMPEYLIYQKESYYPKGTVVMAIEWQFGKRTGWWFNEEGETNFLHYAKDYEPATKEEYDNYIQATNQLKDVE